MTKLIFRVEPGDHLTEIFSLQCPSNHYAEIAADRIGEEVLLGHSVVPGIWSVLAVGRFADWSSDDHSVFFSFEGIRLLREPVTIVTEGDAESDRVLTPYMLDTLLDDDLALISARNREFAQQTTSPLSVAAEAQVGFGTGHVVGGLRHDSQAPAFFHAVADAYGWRCAISGIRQRSPDGRWYDGMVLGVEEPYVRPGGSQNEGMFVSSSFAFAYRHGLVALGDDYDVLRHRDLPAEMRMFLEIANPQAMACLPENPAHWPDLDAIGRHRTKFGY